MPSGGRSSIDVRRRPHESGRLFDEADLDAASRGSTSSARQAPRLENAASQMGERHLASIHGPRLERDGRDDGRRRFSDDRRRVVGAGVRRGRDAEIADMRAIADLGMTNVVGLPLLRPAGGVSSSAVSASRAASTVQRRSSRTTRHRRDQRRQSDRRDGRVRPRRSRRRLRGTRRPVPRRRSCRPLANMVGYHRGLRRVQSTRTSSDEPDWVNIDHRRGSRSRPVT